jgi:hypothetical protein
MIKQSEIEQSIEDLKTAKEVNIEIELNAWEAYSFIVAVQLLKVTHPKLKNVAVAGELAARRLHESFKSSCPATCELLNNGWNLK